MEILNKMIKNSKIVQRFEEELIKKEKIDLTKNFQIMNAMYKEAVALKVIPMKVGITEKKAGMT